MASARNDAFVTVSAFDADLPVQGNCWETDGMTGKDE